MLIYEELGNDLPSSIQLLVDSGQNTQKQTEESCTRLTLAAYTVLRKIILNILNVDQPSINTHFSYASLHALNASLYLS